MSHINPNQNEIELLQIYGQPWEHAEAFLIGNREGLTKLKEALERALYIGEGIAGVFAKDGEGYEIVIEVIDKPWSDSFWSSLASSYTRDRKQKNVVWPVEIFPR